MGLAIATPSTTITSTGATIGSTTAAGLLTYAQAVGGTLTLYDGSTSGRQLCSLSTAQQNFSTPVQFGSSGIYAVMTAGSGVIHTA
jgi:hypothetical protein